MTTTASKAETTEDAAKPATAASAPRSSASFSAQFAHRVMRDFVFAEPARFFETFGEPSRGLAALAGIWDSFGTKVPGLGLGLATVPPKFIHGYQAVCIKFPPPQLPPEAYGALAAWSPGCADTVRYFVLRMCEPTEDGQARQNWWEWRSDSMRISGAFLPTADVEQLIDLAASEIAFAAVPPRQVTSPPPPPPPDDAATAPPAPVAADAEPAVEAAWRSSRDAPDDADDGYLRADRRDHRRKVTWFLIGLAVIMTLWVSNCRRSQRRERSRAMAHSVEATRVGAGQHGASVMPHAGPAPAHAASPSWPDPSALNHRDLELRIGNQSYPLTDMSLLLDDGRRLVVKRRPRWTTYGAGVAVNHDSLLLAVATNDMLRLDSFDATASLMIRRITGSIADARAALLADLQRERPGATVAAITMSVAGRSVEGVGLKDQEGDVTLALLPLTTGLMLQAVVESTGDGADAAALVHTIATARVARPKPTSSPEFDVVLEHADGTVLAQGLATRDRPLRLDGVAFTIGQPAMVRSLLLGLRVKHAPELALRRASGIMGRSAARLVGNDVAITVFELPFAPPLAEVASLAVADATDWESIVWETGGKRHEGLRFVHRQGEVLVSSEIVGLVGDGRTFAVMTTTENMEREQVLRYVLPLVETMTR